LLHAVLDRISLWQPRLFEGQLHRLYLTSYALQNVQLASLGLKLISLSATAGLLLAAESDLLLMLPDVIARATCCTTV